MKNVLGIILNESRYSMYHLASIALFLLGFFVTFTASDLGPFAPLLVSGGIYLVALSILLQAVYWLKAFLRRMLGSWLAS
ncbi:hypothetical protein [Massilia sp. CT11-137]|uniref:hypothetical protein n=1 Tax=Massilia sp. CT11-137 TaxID=3393901 RepID=UPI0039A555C6